jgi:hypothetical protein
MRVALSCAIGAMLLVGSGALAQTAAPAPAPGPLSTATLANICSVPATDTETGTAQGFCRGFLIGAWQYHSEIASPGGRAAIFCLPSPAPTLAEAEAGFVAWAAANPQYGSEKAIDGAMRWAAAAYPCPTPTPARGTGKR